MIIPTTESTLRMTLMQLSETKLELTAVTEQLKAAQDGWHDEITKGLSELRRAESIYTKAQERAERAEEQRDRLAEALQSVKCELGVPQPEYPSPVANAYWIANKALQSLNPDHTVAANDMIAANITKP